MSYILKENELVRSQEEFDRELDLLWTAWDIVDELNEKKRQTLK